MWYSIVIPIKLHPDGIESKGVVATGFGAKTIFHAATSNLTTDSQEMKQVFSFIQINLLYVDVFIN